MPRTILIADGDAAQRSKLAEYLKKDFEPIFAGDAGELITLLRLRGGAVSAILMELDLPGADGFKVMRKLRDNTAYRQIPIIVVTRLADGESRVRALSLGANGFLTKPCGREALVYTVKNAVELRERSAFTNTPKRDELTGLLNRTAFFETAEAMVKRESPGYYILSCLDIENFKVINDQYGTATGDEVLRHIAEKLEKGALSLGGVCCRYSADKFGILYPAQLHGGDAVEAVHREIGYDRVLGRSVRIRVGRYLVDDLGVPVSAMYDRATLAEESIKGRYDIYIAEYSDSMRTRLLNEQKIVNEMNAALKNGEFQVWLQPQYNHATGALVGAEALTRWKKDGGFVLPEDFIPVFERNGFIYEMDQYIWEQVCILLRSWLDRGLDALPVSVNISRRDLYHRHCIERLTDMVEKYRIPTHMLRLEVTESAFAEKSGKIIDRVCQLIELGYTVEIDDFGSGYSSLNTLKDVPASILKLDMRFFENTKNQQRSGNIVESVVRMAKWLGMAVVAEGVEDKEQADYLRSIGCYYIQGYYYAGPMPADDYERLLTGSAKEPELTRLKTIKTLDNNEFWNPKSMETLIFNSYVGGACIFEYHNGKTELLRINEQYTREMGGLIREGARLRESSLVRLLDGEGRERIKGAIQRAMEEGAEASCQVRLSDRLHQEFVRVTVREIARSGDRHLFYCVIVNTTQQRELNEQLGFLNEIARDILAQPDSSAAIESVLEKLLAYFAGDRAYVIELDYQRRESDNTYERCAPGVASEMEKLKRLPFEASDFWFDALRKDQFVVVSDAKAMEGDAAQLRDMLTAQGISALIAAPLWREGVLVGFVGIDNPKKAAEQLERLRALGDYIAVLLTRRDLSAKIDSDRKMMLALMDDTPGGYVRMRVTPENVFVPVYANAGLGKLLGMDGEKLHEIYGEDALAGVHPDDREIVRSAGESMLRDGRAESARFRVKNGAGEYIWLTLYGRMTRDVCGDAYLNVYYTDVTRQVREEDQQKELLDNLPSGAALYEYDGERLRAIHINKSYWQLVGRQSRDCGEISVMDAIHPDDRGLVMQEIDAAIRQNRSAQADARVLQGSSGYKPFRIIAGITPKADGKHLLYVSYLPISEKLMSVQEVLKVALSTMMSVSEELSFVKDRDLRYICCSQSVADMLALGGTGDIVGKTDFELFDRDLAEEFARRDEKILRGGDSLINLAERITMQGHMRTVSTSIYPIAGAGGEVLGLYGVSRDVTAQRERESQLQLLAGSISGGLAAYEIDESGIKMLYFNDGFYKFSGVSREEYARRVAEDPLAFVFEEDRPKIQAMIRGFIEHRVDGHENGCIFRCHTMDGGYRWMSMKTVLSRLSEKQFIVNVMQMDITEQQDERERLRVSEEMNRLAIEHSGNIITRFDVKTGTLTLPTTLNPIFDLPHALKNVPEEQIALGRISADTAGEYRELFEGIKRGEASGSATYKQESTRGWRWLEAQYTTIFANTGEPVSAVISFADVTERLEKEVVYNKWRQSLDQRDESSYALFRCNLSRGASFDSWEGKLLNVSFGSGTKSFDQRAEEYAEQCLWEEDKSGFLAFVKSNTLLSEYYRGRRTNVLEYREKDARGELLWRRLTVDLVEYPSSRDIEAYLMFEDIDEQKKAELLTLERSERDPLTGILNRATFIARMEQRLQNAAPGEKHALLMLDVDNFKRVNDTLGHGAGDELLRALTDQISAMLRHDDLLGRMGGDEFFIFLKNIQGEEAAMAKAKQICALKLPGAGDGGEVTASIGIAMIPKDGEDFDTLYKKVDAALYSQKERGKNGFLFV